MEINLAQENFKHLSRESFATTEAPLEGSKIEATKALVNAEPSVKYDTFSIKDKEAFYEVLESQVKLVNNAFEASGKNLSFFIDDTTSSSVIKVVDRETNEVIRQLPNEEALKMMENIRSYLEMVNQDMPKGKEGLTGSLINGII